MTDNDIQAKFVENAKARTADPMVTETPRVASTLDDMQIFDEGQLADFDDVPGSFENEVLSRLEDLDVAIASVREMNEKTRTAMESIVEAIEGITHQVEPTIKLVMESKLFRMFVPQAKGKN